MLMEQRIELGLVGYEIDSVRLVGKGSVLDLLLSFLFLSFPSLLVLN